MADLSSADTEHILSIRTVVVATFCVVLVVEFVRWVSAGERHRLPPGPRTLPFPLNLVSQILSPENRMEQLMMLKQRYGELCRVDIGGRAKIIISSPELARELFVKSGDVTSDRLVPGALVDTIRYRGGIAFSHGQDWLALRRYSLSALRNFGMGKRSIESRINEEARILLNVLAASQGDSGLNPADFLTNAVSNIICSVTFGERFEYHDPAFLDIVTKVKILFGDSNKAAPVRLLVQKFPSVMRSSWPRKIKMIRENVVGLKDFIVSMVEKHDESFDENDIRDIIDMYLAEARRLKADTDCVKPYLGKENIWMCVFDLFLGGTETTSTALMWFFLIMAGMPEIQMKVAEEISSVIGQERAPLYEDRKRMPYTEATLSEILRFRPVAPFGLPHYASENVRAGDYVIPKGHEMWVNVIGIHHDPELFATPEEFNPSRFLGQDGQTFTKMDAFIPFGLGRRSCLGEQLAKMELFLFATSILQRFVIRLPPGASPDYSIGHRILTLLPKDFNVCLSRR